MGDTAIDAHANVECEYTVRICIEIVEYMTDSSRPNA